MLGGGDVRGGPPRPRKSLPGQKEKQPSGQSGEGGGGCGPRGTASGGHSRVMGGGLRMRLQRLDGPGWEVP